MFRRLLGVLVSACAVAAGGCAGKQPPRGDRPATHAHPARPPADVDVGRAHALGLTRDLPLTYRRACAKHAAYAPAGARVCPPLVPDGAAKPIDAIPFSREPRWSGGFVADFGSRSLDQIGGHAVETNGGHWHYDVSWTAVVERSIVRSIEDPQASDRPSVCRHDARIGSERVEVCHVVPYEHGGGLHGGHIAYLWRHGGVLYVVSVHGYANAPRARAMTQALIARLAR